MGYDDYQEQLFKRYPKNAWLTPSEIFKPYYGMSIGNYILQAEERLLKKHPGQEPIRIVEVGAGTGSAAESILFYFQNFCQRCFHHL
jgi:SAM-dependent MidA family methyltransferase